MPTCGMHRVCGRLIHGVIRHQKTHQSYAHEVAKHEVELAKGDDLEDDNHGHPRHESGVEGGSKTIGLIGGAMLLMNNLAGPTIVSMPGLAQEAGWLSLLSVQVLVASLACWCGLLLIEAMRRMPGNQQLDQQIEFTNVAGFYLTEPFYAAVMTCYHLNNIFILMSLIIQSGQCMDYLILNVHGCAPGFAFEQGWLEYTCGTRIDSVTPFGDSYVLSCAMGLLAIVCSPFALMNLDDNILLQYVAMLGLAVMCIIWLAILTSQPAFPSPLPVATSSQSGLIGTILFNFAFVTPLPTWINEKRPEVSVELSFGLSCGMIVVMYTIIGIIGGMAYEPFFTTDENLFSKINSSGSKIGQATVVAYPLVQNITSIPVFSMIIRLNLIQSKVPAGLASLIAIGLPWMLSIPFYTGRGFETISEVAGLATSSVINFVAPVCMYVLSLPRVQPARESASGKCQVMHELLGRGLGRWLSSGDWGDMTVAGA